MLTQLRNKINSKIDNQLSEANFISATRKLEKFGVLVNSCYHIYYKHEVPLTSSEHLWHTLSHVWFFIVVTRSVKLIVTDDPRDSLYLGDFFSSTKGKGFLHAILIVYYLLFYSSRAAVHIAESRKRLLDFQFFNQIKRSGLSSARQFLTSSGDYTFRVHFYIALQFFFIGIPTVAASLFILCTMFALENPALYQSVYHFIWYFAWVCIITGPLASNIFTLFWSYTHTMTIATYLALAFDTVDQMGITILKKFDSNQSMINIDLVREYLRRQNILLNLLKMQNSAIAPTMWTGYLISCFLADFSLFLGLFVDGGSSVMNVICFALACTAFSNLILLHLSGIKITDKLMDIRERNFSIQARGVKIIPDSLVLWINSTQERFENGEIGLDCCFIFHLTQSSLLYFVLENSGILMMFVANFKKS